MRAAKEQNILKGLLMQDDCMSPLVVFFFLNHEFWPILFLPWSAIRQVKME